MTRGYHLAAIPANKIRIAADWAIGAVLGRRAIQFSLIDERFATQRQE